MERSDGGPRIWDVPCALLDAVLVLAFDEGELENLVTSAGVRVDACLGARSAAVVGVVHRASHRDGPLARRVEKTLDYRFAGLKRECERIGVEAFAAGRLVDAGCSPEEFAGSLWAVATSAEPRARCVTAQANRGVMLEAFECLRQRLLRAASA